MTAPDSLPTDPDALRALLLAERTRHAEVLAAAREEAERQVAEREGEIERLVAIILADWVGRAAFALKPVHFWNN